VKGCECGTGPSQRCPRSGRRCSGEWHSKVTHESITIEAAKQAVACTALGCTRGEQLLLTQIRDFGERVLCPHHALELIEREIGDHQEER